MDIWMRYLMSGVFCCLFYYRLTTSWRKKWSYYQNEGGSVSKRVRCFFNVRSFTNWRASIATVVSFLNSNKFLLLTLILKCVGFLKYTLYFLIQIFVYASCLHFYLQCEKTVINVVYDMRCLKANKLNYQRRKISDFKKVFVLLVNRRALWIP